MCVLFPRVSFVEKKRKMFVFFPLSTRNKKKRKRAITRAKKENPLIPLSFRKPKKKEKQVKTPHGWKMKKKKREMMRNRS